MTKARFAEEFKEEAVREVIERGYSVPVVANRLSVSAQERSILDTYGAYIT